MKGAENKRKSTRVYVYRLDNITFMHKTTNYC